MNNQATLERLRTLKLIGMFEAFEALLRLPLHQQPPADQLLAQLTEAEAEYRQHRRTQMAIRAARFRYQAGPRRHRWMSCTMGPAGTWTKR